MRKISKKTKKVFFGIAISAVVVTLILIFGSTQNDITGTTRNTAEKLEFLFYDLFSKLDTYIEENRVSESAKIKTTGNYDPGILIVDIDEPALAKLGNYNEWDRSIHANVVKNLSNGGAAAIGFDILFKNADFGKLKASQAMKILDGVAPETEWDSIYPEILAAYNYDSMLVDAVRDSKVSIVCDMFDDAKSYKHESQWRPLSSEMRVQEVGLKSTIGNDQVDTLEHIEPKDLLDNVFPELAQAGKFIGSVNAYPDNDGTVRHVSMFYRFPNPYIDATEDTSLVEIGRIDSSHIYSTMSLMTILHLFHLDPKDIKIKVGKYIELGKAFGVYRDSSGEFHTTYPNFSYPMFLALHEKLKTKGFKHEASKNIADISSKIVAQKDKEGTLNFLLFEGQHLDDSFSEALLHITTETLDSVEKGSSLPIKNNLSLKYDEEDDSGNRFIITDEEEDEEIAINTYIVKTINYFKDSIERIPNGKIVHLSMDMDLRYDKGDKRWLSTQPILSDAIIKDIENTSLGTINNLKPGEEYRFGPVKRVPIDRYGKYQVKYKGHYNTDETARTFQHLSYYDVYKQRVDPSFYQGKIFILGSAAAALFDFVPAAHEENYPAVLIHATIIKNILEDDYIVTMIDKYQMVIIILLSILCLALGLYFKSYVSISLSIVLMLIYAVIAFRYFEGGLYLGMSRQLMAMLLTNISALVVQFYFENKEKNFINNAFKQYISPELIDAMVNQEIMPTLGGEKSNISAYFTDIASFSTFSEKIGDPSKLVELLNEYLTAMTDTLLENKGTLDKYEGDAIIAFFGAPMPLENHAQSACYSAVKMQRKLMELRHKWAGEGNKWPKVVHDMHMRIGINSGDIVTGNMGSTMRKNYTMMGDAVNLAARLESAAKQYGAYIQISEDTQKNLEEGRFIYRSLDTVRVVGKSLPVKTFELLEKAGCENEEQLKQLVTIWEKARDCYLAMKWDEAIALFTQCLDLEPHHPERDPGSKTTPSHVYIKRCEAYKVNPPVAEGETWDGVFTATEK